MSKLQFLRNDNVTRGYGVLENFLSHRRSHLADRLIPENSREGKILDIGCGSVHFFLNHISFEKKYGIDKIPNKNIKDINFLNHDFEVVSDLPFTDNFFDVITLLAVIEHINPEKVLPLMTEIRRILKDNGILILTTPAAWSDSLLRFMAKLKLVSPVEIKEHKDIFTPKKLSNIMTQSGFQPDKIRTGYFECFANIWLQAKK